MLQILHFELQNLQGVVHILQKFGFCAQQLHCYGRGILVFQGDFCTIRSFSGVVGAIYWII